LKNYLIQSFPAPSGAFVFWTLSALPPLCAGFVLRLCDGYLCVSLTGLRNAHTGGETLFLRMSKECFWKRLALNE
jgi:hypothetical protein